MIQNILFALGMFVDKYVIWNSFLKKTKDPMRVQDKVLKQILKKNKNTAFGKEHGFNSLKNYTEYKKAVPVQSYEDLRPYIEEQWKTGKPMLTQEQPVLYARTSGTTGKPKFVPILRSTITTYKWSQRIFLYPQYAAYPRMYSGNVLVIASSAVEGYLDIGIPYGSMSGLIYKEMPWFIKRKFVLPLKVFDIEDYDLKYFVIAVYSLAAENITNMVSANPSTFLKLLTVIQEKKTDIIKLIRQGSFSNVEGLTESEKMELNKYLTKNEKRAQELEALFLTHPNVTYADLFQNLHVVSTWMAGSCGALIPILKQKIASTTHIVEVGYLASEFRGSVNIDAEHNYTIPAFHETFLEFIEKNAYEKGVMNFLTLEKIEVKKQYYIFITTHEGLYRYNMNDIIHVTGSYNKTPIIVFVQKGKGTTNMTGEKLYESQVIKAVGELSNRSIKDIQFFMMVADEENLEYTLYLEGDLVGGETMHIEHSIDETLQSMNIEYEAKRKSGRLKSPKVLFLKKGCGEAYKRHEMKNGMRENQFKIQPLRYKREVTFGIKEFIA